MLWANHLTRAVAPSAVHTQLMDAAITTLIEASKPPSYTKEMIQDMRHL